MDLNGGKAPIGLFLSFLGILALSLGGLYTVTIVRNDAAQTQLRHDLHEETMEKYNEITRRLDQMQADMKIFQATVLPRADVDRLVADLKIRIEDMKADCRGRKQ